MSISWLAQESGAWQGLRVSEAITAFHDPQTATDRIIVYILALDNLPGGRSFRHVSFTRLQPGDTARVVQYVRELGPDGDIRQNEYYCDAANTRRDYDALRIAIEQGVYDPPRTKMPMDITGKTEIHQSEGAAVLDTITHGRVDPNYATVFRQYAEARLGRYLDDIGNNPRS